jgi:methylenetetrahydrofolate reductase (NADPH)
MADQTSPVERSTNVAVLEPAQRAAFFARTWSLEATRPTQTEIEALGALLRGGTPVYLSAPGQTHEEQVASAAQLRAHGLEPVPHVAARRIADRAALETLVRRHCDKAGVRQALVIGGDVEAAGAFGSALEVIASGVLEACGIEEIGIAGYPDGHPRIPEATLERALLEKLEAAAAAGLRAHVVTQFCFDPQQIVAWLLRLRRRHIGVPVRVGVVGPTSVKTLLNFARRCGVKASTRGLLQRPGLVGALLGEQNPQPILRALIEGPAEVGDISPHFFSFGGAMKTAEFAHAAAQNNFAEE